MTEGSGVPARRVLRLLGVGLLAILLVDVIVIVGAYGWLRGLSTHPASSGEVLVPLLWAAAGALIAVAMVAASLTVLIIAALLVVRARRTSQRGT